MLIQFSQLEAIIDTEKNMCVKYVPTEEFLGAPCSLMGRVEAQEYGITHVEFMFVHKFNPSEIVGGEPIPFTNLEWVSYSKPTQDLRDKSWNGIAFDRNKNKIVSFKSWSVWASDKNIKENWLNKLKNEHSNVPLI